MEYIYENLEATGLEITEANQSQLSEGVLAKVKGPSFFLDGFSRNGRFYPKELWENALKNPSTKQALERGLMFGCIGHPKDYTLDELLESGKVSHKVTDIYIEKKTGQGIAEYEILDTPSGRILNTVLRSGSNMYVSTRAFGGFTNETKEKDGKKYKVLDPKNFMIESIDFVIQPGFLETNPQLVESLKEDFEALKEDKYQIQCEDGICGLDLDQMNEDKNENENREEETKVEKVEIDKELLEKLSKEEIITMLENVVNENKILAEKMENELPKKEVSEEDNNNADMMVSAKLMMNYVSYVELLTKMVRYNVEYEKYYDKLIEFLDKDSKLTTKDMEDLNVICDEILKEKDVDESIQEVCNRIKELSEKMNKDAETPDKGSEEKEPSGSEEDNSPEFKPDESLSIVDFMFGLKVKLTESELVEQERKKNESLLEQLMKMKESTIFLTKKLDEEMSKEPEVKTEVVTETKVEYKIPEDFNEKFIEIKSQLEEYETSLEEAEKRVIELTEELERKNSSENETILSLEEKLNEYIEREEENKSIFKEILDEKKEEYERLAEDFGSIVEKLEKKEEEIEKVHAENESLYESLNETKARYLSAFHRLELNTVKKFMEMYKDDKELQTALEKEEKAQRRHKPVTETHIPDYNPRRKSSSEAKSKFLENLTR